jgi:hypothetical protein
VNTLIIAAKRKEIHNALPPMPAAGPIKAYMPAPRIIPTPKNTTSKSPILRLSFAIIMKFLLDNIKIFVI